MNKQDLFVSSLMAFISLALCIDASMIPLPTYYDSAVGAGDVPMVIFGLLFIVSSINLIRAIISLRAGSITSAFNFKQIKTPVIILIALGVYIAVMDYIGFLISSAIFLPALMIYLSDKRAIQIKAILVVCAVAVPSIYLLFTEVVTIFLPEGKLF